MTVIVECIVCHQLMRPITWPGDTPQHICECCTEERFRLEAAQAAVAGEPQVCIHGLDLTRHCNDCESESRPRTPPIAIARAQLGLFGTGQQACNAAADPPDRRAAPARRSGSRR